MFEVFFFSLGETYAGKHYQELSRKVPGARLVEGLTPPKAAWTKAAQLCHTSHFFSVDADNLIDPRFTWSVPGFQAEDPRVHVWRCRNPVNGLVYGHGAVKLWSVEKVITVAQTNTVGRDFTVEMSQHGFLVQEELASTTHFNQTPEETWKSAFKECFKLATHSTRYFNSTQDENLLPRLAAWSCLGRDAHNGEYSMLGARMALYLAQTGKVGADHFSSRYRSELWQGLGEIEKSLRRAGQELAGIGIKLPEIAARESAEIKKVGALEWAREVVNGNWRDCAEVVG
jgi:hypothetical protein